MWCHTSAIPAFSRFGQEDLEFKASNNNGKTVVGNGWSKEKEWG
jgi:uncharacterized membrane protein